LLPPPLTRRRRCPPPPSQRQAFYSGLQSHGGGLKRLEALSLRCFGKWLLSDGHPGLAALLQRAAPTLQSLHLSRVGERSPLDLEQADMPALRCAGFAASPLTADTWARLSALTRLEATSVSLNGRALPPSLRGLRELAFGEWVPEAGVGRAALAPSVTALFCRLPNPDDLDSLSAAFPAVTILKLSVKDWTKTAPQAAARWRGLRSLCVPKGGSWCGVLGLLRGGDRCLTHLGIFGSPPTPDQPAEALRLAPALEEVGLVLPRDGDLSGLFAPLLLAQHAPPAAGTGPTLPRPGQRLARLELVVKEHDDLRALTVDGLLALGRALPALTVLTMEAVDAYKGAELRTGEACRELLEGLRAVGRGGGCGEPAEADAPTAPAPATAVPPPAGGPPPTFSELLPAVRAALARLAAAQGA
jgi:hypothetical protein